MQSTGENVQWMPVAATSTAVARAARSSRSASQVAAMPSCVGKIVAPSQNECPWMQSSAISSGICSRVRAVSSCAWRTRSGDVCRIDPTCRLSDEVVDAVLGVQLHHLADLLLERHAPDEVGDALGDGEGRVLVRRVHGDVLGSLGSIRDEVCEPP